uniref:Leucine-rich repeat protein n=1 Tax=Paramoeba aestuarina TaxID=180227 RepID=A0A7S4PEA9_9EUKA|mmetsp:Transcript_4157/g.6266  ORF Transcript_4157/g.6266 Transcript_4157/m.6266 type:complete len:220 (+) Transcript_4157:30-689(+)
MMNVILTLASDLHIGKVDKDLFAQETLLKMFIDGIENKEAVFSLHTNDGIVLFTVTGRNGRTIYTPEGECTLINWSKHDLRGCIRLECLPNTVEEVDVQINFLTGEVNLTDLPRSMVSLNVSDNVFTGYVALTSLPHNLKRLNICRNQFCGSLDMTSLPSGLESLDISLNYFEGELDFDKLPSSLRTLNISTNEEISGQVQRSPERRVSIRNTKVVFKE